MKRKRMGCNRPLDPAVEGLIGALARAAARRDHAVMAAATRERAKDREATLKVPAPAKESE